MAAPQGFQKETRHGTQNGSKNGPKSKTKTKTKKEGLEDRLGPVLSPSWVVLGLVLGPWKRPKHYARRCFVNNRVFEKMKCQEATWAELGPIWMRFGCPRGSKMEPKRVPKRSEKREEKWSEVKRGLRSKLEGEAWKPRSCYEAAGGVRGDQYGSSPLSFRSVGRLGSF